MRQTSIWAAVLFLGFAATTALTLSRSPIPAPDQKATLPAGSRILIRTTDAIDSSKQKAGYRFTASLETNLQVDSSVVAVRGTTVYGRLAEAKSAGKVSGSSQLTLELTDIVIKGTPYPLVTSTYELRGAGEGKNTAKKAAGGAGLGGLIGGIAGGGKGLAIGAVAGAAGGTALASTKKGEQLLVPSESLIEFRLEHPVTLPVVK